MRIKILIKETLYLPITLDHTVFLKPNRSLKLQVWKREGRKGGVKFSIVVNRNIDEYNENYGIIQRNRKFAHNSGSYSIFLSPLNSNFGRGKEGRKASNSLIVVNRNNNEEYNENYGFNQRNRIFAHNSRSYSISYHPYTPSLELEGRKGLFSYLGVNR